MGFDTYDDARLRSIVEHWRTTAEPPSPRAVLPKTQRLRAPRRSATARTWSRHSSDGVASPVAGHCLPAPLATSTRPATRVSISGTNGGDGPTPPVAAIHHWRVGENVDHDVA